MGFLVLIDEADNASKDANLGAFIKLFTERAFEKMAGLVRLN
jgi:hypothetical protein